MRTYDVHFNDSENSNAKGFKKDIRACVFYIRNRTATNDSYFADYKGGTVSIVCNETGRIIYSEDIPL